MARETAKYNTGSTFFTRDRSFYRQLFSIFIMVALQNLVAYSVNMIDNVMMGSYSQTALSGAATVNQIFFLVQQTAISVCDANIILASQYYGQGRMSPVRKITGVSLKLGLGCGLFFAAVCGLFPVPLLHFFTRDAAIIEQGQIYLQIILFTFPLFILTNVLMAALRCVGTVKISFYISVVSLIINTCINYVLIFGRFGFPEMGIRGAAVGTLTARIAELLIVLGYVRFRDRKLQLFSENFLSCGRQLTVDFLRVGGLSAAADGDSGSSAGSGRVGCHRGKFGGNDLLSVSQSGRESYGLGYGCRDGTDGRQGGSAPHQVRRAHGFCIESLCGNCSRCDSFPAAWTAPVPLQPDTECHAPGRSDHDRHVLCHGRHGLSDARLQRCPARKRRHEIFADPEYSQCLGNCYAALPAGRFCLAAACAGSRPVYPVRSDFQGPACLFAGAERQVDQTFDQG